MDERGITGRTVTLAAPPAERLVPATYSSPFVLTNDNDNRPNDVHEYR